MKEVRGVVAPDSLQSPLTFPLPALFSLSQTNVTTNTLFLKFLKDIWLPTATDTEIASLAAAYPDDVAAGSPYNTGPLNELYTNYKRIAAFQGDIWFQVSCGHNDRRP